jgi:hypothetical protein
LICKHKYYKKYIEAIKEYFDKYKSIEKINSIFKIYTTKEKIKIYHNDFDLFINYK